MKNLAAIFRITLFMVVSVFTLELFIDSGDQWALANYPSVWVVLGLLLFLAIVFEVVAAAVQRVLFQSLSPEAKKRYIAEYGDDEEGFSVWLQKTIKKLQGSKPIEKEHDIVLDHSYDGIRELDNNLPPWWVYMFYATIVFAVVYLLRYHVFDGTDQIQEFEIEMAQAKAQIEEYKKNNKDLIDVNTVELLTGDEDLASGKSIFIANCAACHKDTGAGGIGPNLTDDYWILGGGIKNIFHTISEGGRPGKGMIAWKTDLKPAEIAQVASYVMSLHGSNPVDPKDPEGDLWVDPNAPVDHVEVKKIDSTTIELKMTDDPVVDDLSSESR